MEISKLKEKKKKDDIIKVTKKSYIKMSIMRSYGSTDKNEIVDGDKVVLEQQVTTKSHIMLFTNKNHYMYIPVYEIGESRWGDEGLYYTKLGAEPTEDEVIVNAVVIEEEDKDKNIFIIKSNGLVKRTKVEDHFVTRHFNFYDASKLRDNEELLGAWLVEEEGFIGIKSKDKKAMYFAINECAPKGLKTNGMSGHKYKEDAYDK